MTLRIFTPLEVYINQREAGLAQALFHPIGDALLGHGTGMAGHFLAAFKQDKRRQAAYSKLGRAHRVVTGDFGGLEARWQRPRPRGRGRNFFGRFLAALCDLGLAILDGGLLAGMIAGATGRGSEQTDRPQHCDAGCRHAGDPTRIPGRPRNKLVVPPA